MEKINFFVEVLERIAAIHQEIIKIILAVSGFFIALSFFLLAAKDPLLLLFGA